MSVRLIVFDLDGTLVDSREDIADSANATLASYGAQPLSEDAIGRMVGDGIVSVRVLADAVVVEQPVAVTKGDLLGNGIHLDLVIG